MINWWYYIIMSGESDFSNVTSSSLMTSRNFTQHDIKNFPIFENSFQEIEIPFLSIGGAFIPDRFVQVAPFSRIAPVPKIIPPDPQIKDEHRQNYLTEVVQLDQGVHDFTQKMQLSNSMENLTTEQSRICGLPGFCSKSAYDTCYNTTLRNCSECSGAASLAFIIFAVCLGLAIFVGNSLILTVGYKRHKKGKESKLDICRSSLAFADILTGKSTSGCFYEIWKSKLFSIKQSLE